MLHRKTYHQKPSATHSENSWTRLLASILLGSEKAFPQHCRLSTGGGLVLVWHFQVMSAAVGDFRLSNSDTTELEAAVPSLSESKVIVYRTRNSVGYYWHHLCWKQFLHVQKVNYARSSTVYSRITLTPYSYLLFRKLCPPNSRIPSQ